MLTTTLADIKACSPNQKIWERLHKGLGATYADKKSHCRWSAFWKSTDFGMQCGRFMP